MTIREYSTPFAFKQALESRLRASSSTGADFARRRQLLVFERFLARITQIAGEAVTLKGGLVLELRLAKARTTKDVDLRMTGSPSEVLARLQEAGRLDLGDHMVFEVQPDAQHPEMQNDGMRYEGYRYRSECRLAGKVYGRPFGVDVAFGDPVVGEPDVVQAEDTLGFAGITPPTLRLYPVVSHIAEKLHALTMPRPRPNSRIRDLPDLALLATTGSIEAERLRKAIETTFSFRDTHPVPTAIPRPSEAWDAPYAEMATANQLPWATLQRVTEAVSLFLDPVLQANHGGTWEPDRWAWQ